MYRDAVNYDTFRTHELNNWAKCLWFLSPMQFKFPMGDKMKNEIAGMLLQQCL